MRPAWTRGNSHYQSDLTRLWAARTRWLGASGSTTMGPPILSSADTIKFLKPGCPNGLFTSRVAMQAVIRVDHGARVWRLPPDTHVANDPNVEQVLLCILDP